jgi:hypothetical protein
MSDSTSSSRYENGKNDKSYEATKVALDIEDAFNKVPEIGTKWRWYDIPYRAFGWLHRSWRRRILPRRVRHWTYLGMNYLIQFNEHERKKVRDVFELHGQILDSEQVSIPSLWVVELYPPSQVASLNRSIESHSWDKEWVWLLGREENRDYLQASRANTGSTWWDVADIVDDKKKPEVHSSAPTRADLPASFKAVRIRGVHVGPGLTALVATFDLVDSVAEQVNAALHKDYDPELVCGSGMPRSEGRAWVRYRKTQQSRKLVHDEARQWIRDECPGFFAAHSLPPVLIDLVMTDLSNPFSNEERSIEQDETLRSLGIVDFGHLIVSEQLGGLVLNKVSSTLCPNLFAKGTWSLWGNRDDVLKKIGDDSLSLQGSNAIRAVGHHVGNSGFEFFVMLALDQMIYTLESIYAEARDQVATRQARFSSKGIEILRNTLLSLSLDVGNIDQGVRDFYTRPYYAFPAFMVTSPERVKDGPCVQGYLAKDQQDYSCILMERGKSRLKDLVAMDKNYRDIVSTLAALGAASDTRRVGRIAIVVAGFSLLVALVTLLVGSIKPDSLIFDLVHWLDLFEFNRE